MHLVIDIGNTRVKLACFDGKEMVYFHQGHRDDLLQLPDLVPDFGRISAAIYTPSSFENSVFEDNVALIPCVIKLTYQTAVPIKNGYHSPKTLGMDRLAAAVGAYTLHPEAHAIVIDMGTCITMDCIEKGGTYLGGNISPGIPMRIKAMHHYTRTLPLVSTQIAQGLLGTDTTSALQQGGVNGACREIEAFLNETSVELGNVNVILTGGDAHIFESYTKKQIFVLPYLVMEGLNEILHYNVSKI